MTDTTQAKARSTLSQALAAFVDALLPGNTEWPSGATLGIQHPMLERLVAQNEENALLGLAQSLESIGAPFVGLDAQARTAALKKMEKSTFIGEILAKRAKDKNISQVYFDRGQHKYHGRVRTFAETLRKNGLKF